MVSAERGFSLVELLVAMVVSFLVVGGAALLGAQVQSSYRGQLEAAAAQQEGRYALQWIERYLRAAGNNPYRLLTTPCPVAGTPVQANFLCNLGYGDASVLKPRLPRLPFEEVAQII